MAWEAIFSAVLLLTIASLIFFSISTFWGMRAAGVSATCGGGIETTGEWEFKKRNQPRKKKPWFGFRNRLTAALELEWNSWILNLTAKALSRTGLGLGQILGRDLADHQGCGRT